MPDRRAERARERREIERRLRAYGSALTAPVEIKQAGLSRLLAAFRSNRPNESTPDAAREAVGEIVAESQELHAEAARRGGGPG